MSESVSSSVPSRASSSAQMPAARPEPAAGPSAGLDAGLPAGTRLDTPTGPVERWAGVRFATAARFEAPRLHDALPTAAGMPGPAPAQPLPYYEDPGAPVSEDCLNLTVWAPADRPARADLLPVVVWVYGGGFEHGANSSAFSDASALAGTGRVVSVSLNYRTGVLGFLSLSYLDGYPQASNLGLRDVVTALEWVHRHVAAFGGDPERVTVVGESAGAFLAGALPAVPTAQGRFSRLALFSGGASRIVPAWRAREMTRDFLGRLGVEAEPQQLRTAGLEELFAAQPCIAVGDIGQRNSTAPQALGVVDDSAEPDGLLRCHPMRAYERGAGAATPLLVCATRDEISAFRDPSRFDPPDLDAVQAEVEALGVCPQQAARIVTHYAALAPAPTGEDAATPGLVRQRMLSDWIYRLPAARLAAVQAAAGGQAWLAMTGRAGGEQAGHACDAPALLGQHWPGSDDVRLARDAEITTALLDFATTGSPGWEPVSAVTLPGARGAAGAGETTTESGLGAGDAGEGAGRGQVRAEALSLDPAASVPCWGEARDAVGDYRQALAAWAGVDRP